MVVSFSSVGGRDCHACSSKARGTLLEACLMLEQAFHETLLAASEVLEQAFHETLLAASEVLEQAFHETLAASEGWSRPHDTLGGRAEQAPDTLAPGGRSRPRTRWRQEGGAAPDCWRGAEQASGRGQEGGAGPRHTAGCQEFFFSSRPPMAMYVAHLEQTQEEVLRYKVIVETEKQRKALQAAAESVQRGGEMSELDDAGTYFDLGPKQVTQVGTYYYLCTRNNNFSNRDQKSKIIVQSNPYSNARVGGLGGFVTVSSNMISFPPAALTSLVKVQVEIFQNASGAQAITNSPNTPDYTVSAFTWVGPQQFPDVQGSATVQLALSGTGPNVQTNSGGMFVAASSKTAIISVATVLVVIVVLATVVTVSLVVYFRVKKGAWQKFKTAVKNVPKLRRHVAGKV
ncbi:hypothetical protein EMCRGX_G002066 [Ephydatia muelleri]